MNRRTAVLSVLSGVLLFLSFPKMDWSLAAFGALVPLFVALEGKSWKEALRAGILTGLAWHIGVLYWIVYVVMTYGYLPMYVGITAMLALAAYLSLYTGLFAVGIAFFQKSGFPLILAAPVLWTSLEYMKSHLLTGFPWGNLAYSQYLITPLVQIADVTGPYGISFMVVLVNGVLYRMLRCGRRERRRVIVEAAFGLFLIFAVVIYGLYRVEEVREGSGANPSADVLIVQGNIDQSVKWNPSYQDETVNIYRGLSLGAVKKETRLIVWPETAAPFYFQDVNDYHRAVTDVALRSGAYLLLGSVSYKVVDGRDHTQNSAFLVTPMGQIAGKYDKVHLVPYGEYVPLRPIFPFMGDLIGGIGDFLPGQGFQPLTMDGVSIGTLICYEGIFPEIAGEYRRRGANVFVNITNDAWFGKTSAPYQHLSMITLRSIENRAYTVRAANTGISAIIDPAGRILARTELFKKTTLRGTIGLTGGRTFYSRYGDLFAYGCMASLSLLFIIALRRKER